MPKGCASRWTIQRKKLARRRYEQGASLAEIAADLGSNTGRVADAIRSVGGKIRNRYWDEAKALLARARYEQGETLDEIATDLGANRTTVAAKIRSVGGLIRKTGAPLHRNRNWQGGRIADTRGYILLKLPTHPHANSQGYVREHRLVMEKQLGRYLESAEVVHHKNGDPADNRASNLELFSSNGKHLAHELAGRKPRWSKEGEQKIAVARKRRPTRS
jgi:hypothetical protein